MQFASPSGVPGPAPQKSTESLDQQCARTLDHLLRFELSAVDTYRMILGHLGEDPFRNEIECVLRDHRNAAEALRNYVVTRGGTPSQSGGPWEVLAHLVVAGAARLLGNERALRVLRHGEQRGCAVYEQALEDPAFDTECKVLVRQMLLPKQKAHVQDLDRVLAAEA